MTKLNGDLSMRIREKIVPLLTRGATVGSVASDDDDRVRVAPRVR